ncbi:hypothetical protein AU255_03645 [Methyloprofundus sedimenti]|uniref:Uncharacterized protein n=1 Tax=Methyloprofundus sedimenti TaxID=1420851 RepID=A0A1V8M627_9GAMM|nr:hypothetical protein [Methyloprofundus sedimenti]OQK17005.1 hypothetical protein AU255_03645 [Methyloprofundus sedimenti]
MYLLNDFKLHRTLLLNFFPQIKVEILLSEDKDKQHELLTIFFDALRASTHPVLFIYGLFFIPKVVSRRIQKAANNKASLPICLEISKEKLNELLKNKQICAADIRCLDSGSKQCLMKLCLQNCLAGK